MRWCLFSLLLCVLGLTGCRPSQTNQNLIASPSPRPSAAAVKSKIDVCNLLSSDDLKSVQGEAYKDAQRSDRLDGEFIDAQCYYALPTMTNSVVVNVTTANDQTGSGRSPKVHWEQSFGGAGEKEREGKGEREREKREREEKVERDKKKPRPGEREAEGEEKEGSPPERVKDLGDEAFWVGSPIGGALYVLKDDLFFRVSVGGTGNQQAKLIKSKTLAQKILKKL